MQGLQTIVNGTAWTLPANKAPEFKVGLEYNTSNVKAKFLTNVRSLLGEGSFTYLHANKWLVGSNLNLNLQTQKITKNEIGLNWSPAKGAIFGLLHQAPSDKPLEIGKFWVYFNHAATSSQVVGTEFAYDWSKKAVEAKLGASHKFNDTTSGKFKIDHNAKVDAVLKHKYNDTVTVSLATGFSLKTIVVEQKSKALPVGLAFDLKF